MRFTREEVLIIRAIIADREAAKELAVIDAGFPTEFTAEEVTALKSLVEIEESIHQVTSDNSELIDDEGMYHALSIDELKQVRELIKALKPEITTNPENEKPEKSS
jgi:hypothetical protein